MHLWATDFGFTPQDAVRLSDIFKGISLSVIMFNLTNLNTGSLTRGRGEGEWIYPNLLCLTQIFFFFFFNRETHFRCCPMLPSPPSNTKHSVDQPCTHDIPSNTKHNVDIYHPLTPMSCDVLVHNAMQSCHCSFIPYYIYDECYMCIPTHA